MRLISGAFSGVPRPAYTLADAAVADEWGKESARFAQHDRTWEEIPDEQIARSTAAFCFLPLTSWSYYIPAYMAWTVRHIHDYRTETPTHLVYTLTEEHACDFRDTLTVQQREAVLAFLDLWRAECPDWTTEAECSMWRPHAC